MNETIDKPKPEEPVSTAEVTTPQTKWPEIKTEMSVPKAGPGEHGGTQADVVQVIYRAGRNPL